MLKSTILAIAFLSTLSAAPITGTANISGSFGIGSLSVDFYGAPLSGCSTSGLGTDGCFTANVPLTGDFATLTPGVFGGSIKDIQGPPISGSISLSNFIVFANGIVFDLTVVMPGGAPDCALVNGFTANVSCTPIFGGEVSPYVFSNSADGKNATVAFNVLVNGYTVGPDLVSIYAGAFSSQMAGRNIASILADLNGGATVAASYSANFSDAGVPEPQSFFLIGSGLMAVYGIRRKAKNIRLT